MLNGLMADSTTKTSGEHKKVLTYEELKLLEENDPVIAAVAQQRKKDLEKWFEETGIFEDFDLH